MTETKTEKFETVRIEIPSESKANYGAILYPVYHVYPIHSGPHRLHDLDSKSCWCRPTYEKPDDLVSWQLGLEHGWVSGNPSEDGPLIVLHSMETGITPEGFHIDEP